VRLRRVMVVMGLHNEITSPPDCRVVVKQGGALEACDGCDGITQ